MSFDRFIMFIAIIYFVVKIGRLGIIYIVNNKYLKK